MNLKIKFRESFRPFAPAVLKEHAHEYFEMQPGHDSPYMLLVAPVQQAKRRPLTADEATATGIDEAASAPLGDARDHARRLLGARADRRSRAPRPLLEAARQLRAQNRLPGDHQHQLQSRREPIVCTPEEAYDTFMGSDIDVLCMGHFVLEKAAQPAWIEVGDAERPEAILDEVWCSPCHQAPLEVAAVRPHARRAATATPLSTTSRRCSIRTRSSRTPSDVTELVKSFYEETPFPNYDEVDSVRSLIDKSRRGQYASY